MGYITVTEAADWIGLQPSPVTDPKIIAKLQQMIDATTEAINAYTETRFDAPQVKTGELHDARRQDILVFECWPVISVQQVVLGVGGDGAGGGVLPSTEYAFDESELRLRFINLPLQRGYLRVDYTWGYSAVPERVKMACKISVEAYWRHLSGQRQGVNSKSKEGETISYSGPGSGGGGKSGLPKEACSLLADFRFCEWPAGARGAMATRNT